jgi:serine/threonine protein kinase
VCVPHSPVANQVEPSDFQLHVYHTERNTLWGSLFHARSKPKAHTHYVIHAIAKSPATPGVSRADSDKLLEGMKQLKPHPYVLKQVHSGESEDTVFGVYTPAFHRYTSLQSYLRANQRFPEAVTKLLAAQVLLAVQHLHEQNLTARNLSSETVHLDSDGNAVLCDVWLAGGAATPKELLAPEYQPPETINASAKEGGCCYFTCCSLCAGLLAH